MRLKLTKRTIKELTPQERPYKVYDIDIKGFYVRVQPSGSITYRYVYRNHEGIQRDYKIGTEKIGAEPKPVQARDVAEELRGKVRKGIDVVAERTKNQEDAKLRKTKTLRAYLEHVYSHAISGQRTAGKKINRIKAKFAIYLDDELEDLTRWKLNPWVSKERKKGNSEWTIKRDLSDLKALLSHALEHGRITVNPIARWTPENTEDNSRVRFLDSNERQRLLESLDQREEGIRVKRASANKWREERGRAVLENLEGKFADHLKPIVLMSLHTGLRRRELFELEWAMVEFNRGWITITSRTAKSKRTRHIPMNSVVNTTLQTWKNQSGDSALVFPGKQGKPLTNVDSAWKHLLGVAKIENFTWHDTRHDFASQLVMKGVDIYRVKELLGHSSIQQTERYAHLAPQHLQDTVERLC